MQYPGALLHHRVFRAITWLFGLYSLALQLLNHLPLLLNQILKAIHLLLHPIEIGFGYGQQLLTSVLRGLGLHGCLPSLNNLLLGYKPSLHHLPFSLRERFSGLDVVGFELWVSSSCNLYGLPAEPLRMPVPVLQDHWLRARRSAESEHLD
eukprot:s5314_g3.t1